MSAEVDLNSTGLMRLKLRLQCQDELSKESSAQGAPPLLVVWTVHAISGSAAANAWLNELRLHKIRHDTDIEIRNLL